jgi:hypothetical protein
VVSPHLLASGKILEPPLHIHGEARVLPCLDVEMRKEFVSLVRFFGSRRGVDYAAQQSFCLVLPGGCWVSLVL